MTKAQELTKLSIQIDKTRKLLADLEQQMADHRLEMLRTVEMIRNDSSITLVLGDRKINARKNRYGRYTVKEGRKTLDSDYLGGIHDLRFAMALGSI